MFTSDAQPPAQGLYDGLREHDACGVALVATLTGLPSHDIVVKALTALRNLEHRGASGAEPDSGDGAGILLQVPDLLLRGSVSFALPAPGSYAVGIGFLPVDPAAAEAVRYGVSAIAAHEGLRVPVA
jgi:glutamate synthase (NADPH) large chain